jgi:hypothetical protein
MSRSYKVKLKGGNVTRGYLQISQYMGHFAGYNEVKSNALKET